MMDSLEIIASCDLEFGYNDVVFMVRISQKSRNVLFPVLFYSVLSTLMKKKFSSKICFRFQLIYISKFIGQYIYRNQSNLLYKKYSK